MTFNMPPKEFFTDGPAYASVVLCLARLYGSRVVRRAVRKQFIRRSQWFRFAIAFRLFGFAVMPLSCLAILFLIAWFDAHPGLYDQVGLSFLARRAVAAVTL